MQISRLNINNNLLMPSSRKLDVSSSKPISLKQSGLEHISNYNKANISFKGYYGDQQPAKKLFWILTGRHNICRDDETIYKTYHTGSNKKWVTTNPEDLLKRTPEQAIQSICTLNDNYESPSYILSPNYGDKWGRRANYIEINPRLVALTRGDEKQEGLLNVMKLLPAHERIFQE